MQSKALETGGIMEEKFLRNTKKKRLYSFGFTLVELMVVIAIIGIVAVLAVPNFARMQREARIRSACQRTAQHFKQIRERAISSGGTYLITFPDLYHYRMTRPNSTTQDFRIGGLAGQSIYWGGAGVAGQPPEGSMAAPGVNGRDFPGDRLVIDGRGGATNGVLYITNGRNNYAVGINRIGKVATYRYHAGTWN
jgi:prepilin-type N-terminal cleavage/methylation domain-containing protein